MKKKSSTGGMKVLFFSRWWPRQMLPTHSTLSILTPSCQLSLSFSLTFAPILCCSCSQTHSYTLLVGCHTLSYSLTHPLLFLSLSLSLSLSHTHTHSLKHSLSPFSFFILSLCAPSLFLTYLRINCSFSHTLTHFLTHSLSLSHIGFFSFSDETSLKV